MMGVEVHAAQEVRPGWRTHAWPNDARAFSSEWSAHARLSRREGLSVRRRRARPAETMWRIGLAFGLGVALEALLGWLLKRRRASSSTAIEVIFFPSKVTCTEELLAGVPCVCPLPHGESALSRLLVRVLEARRSLDLCFFAFSSPQLGRAVLLLHSRGVRVRLVIDSDYMALRGSQIGPLRRAGIPVRHDQDRGYMHHKFAIVDKKVLITGSLNWTTQAIQTNQENVLVVEDQALVNIFVAEFEKIWENYNPANYTFFSKHEKTGIENA